MIQHSIELYIFKNFKGMLSCMYCLIFFPPGILFLRASFPSTHSPPRAPPKKENTLFYSTFFWLTTHFIFVKTSFLLFLLNVLPDSERVGSIY